METIVGALDPASFFYTNQKITRVKLPTYNGTVVQTFDTTTLSFNNGTLAATLPTIGGKIVSSFSPNTFSIDGNGQISVTGGGTGNGTVLTFNSANLGTAALDPAFFTSTTGTNTGTLSLATTSFSALPLASALSASTQIMVVISGVPYYTTLGAFAGAVV